MTKYGTHNSKKLRINNQVSFGDQKKLMYLKTKKTLICLPSMSSISLPLTSSAKFCWTVFKDELLIQRFCLFALCQRQKTGLRHGRFLRQSIHVLIHILFVMCILIQALCLTKCWILKKLQIAPQILVSTMTMSLRIPIRKIYGWLLCVPMPWKVFVSMFRSHALGHLQNLKRWKGMQRSLSLLPVMRILIWLQRQL